MVSHEIQEVHVHCVTSSFENQYECQTANRQYFLSTLKRVFSYTVAMFLHGAAYFTRNSEFPQCETFVNARLRWDRRIISSSVMNQPSMWDYGGA